MIYIDIQHIGKPNRPHDMGASFGDRPEETEAYWTSLYAFYLEMRLKELGYPVMRLTDGDYQDRHDRVNQYERNRSLATPSIYISAHINAGGGDYACMFYDSRSSRGYSLAKAIGDKLSTLPNIGRCKAIPATSENWTKNAYYTIRNVQRPISICSEPLFIDHDQHRQYLTHNQIHFIGEEIANGIHSWYTQQQEQS